MKVATSLRIWVSVVCLVVLAGLAQADTITVGPGGGCDYATIQEGIDAANNGDTVLVADGTYTGPDNKNLDFGGFAITLQSENGPENCIIDCENDGRGFYFHSGEDANSVLSGFTIKNGYVYDDSGGGIYCSGASPAIENCIITDNHVYGREGSLGANPDGGDALGGGIYCTSNSNLTVIRCAITNNTSEAGDGVDAALEPPGKGGDSYGAGIYFDYSSTMTIQSSSIVGNIASGGKGGYMHYANAKDGGNSYGAGICCGADSVATIINCMVNNNEALGGDGADYWDSFYDYDAGDGGDARGGGIYSYTSSECTIENCTIVDNITSGGIGGTAFGGGADGDDGNTYGAGVYCDAGSTVTTNNSIIWGNDVNEIDGIAGVNYSDVEGGYSGNNIDADPLFVTGPSGDYYLSQIAAGQASDSPCVNAGSDSAVNLGMDIFTTRIDKVWDDGIVDMGYHYSGNLADLNDSGHVNLGDFAILASQWQEAPGLPSADIAPEGGDGIVDEKDLEVFCNNWLWK